MSSINQQSIEQLQEEKIIGRRLYSLLCEARINNLLDLQHWLDAMGIEAFAKYKNFGARCREELEDLVAAYGLHCDDTVRPEEAWKSKLIVDATADFQADLDLFYASGMPDAEVLKEWYPTAAHYVSMALNSELLPRLDNLGLPPQTRVDIWNRILEILENILSSEKIQALPMIHAHVQNYVDLNRQRLAKLKWDKLVVTYRNQLVHRELQDEYEAIINSYPKRSQNAAMEYFSDYREAMLRYCLDHMDMTEIHNCGNKSYKDLLEIFKEFYETSPDVFSLSGEDLELKDLEAKYPQLGGSGTKFVLDFRRETGRLPLWYLLARFILTDINQAIVHFRTVHGIGTGRNYGYSASAAAKYSGDGLTEMLRQVEFAPNCPHPDDPGWEYYDFLRLPIIGPNLFDFQELSAEENLSDITFDNFLGLLQFLRGGKIFTAGRYRYWIPEDVAAGFPVRDVVKALEEAAASERENTLEIDVRELFNYREDRPLDDVRIDVARVIATVLGYDAEDNSCIVTLAPNTVNVTEEVIRILSNSEYPLPLSEILLRFLHFNPDHKVNNERLMRPYLNNSPQIVLVNRRRGYTLVDRMVKEAEMKRAAQGIPEHPEIKRNYRVRRSKNDPFPFYTMLIEYRNFIFDNGRFPRLDSEDPEEVNVKLWRDDMISGRGKCTPEEYQDLLRNELELKEMLLNRK